CAGHGGVERGRGTGHGMACAHLLAGTRPPGSLQDPLRRISRTGGALAVAPSDVRAVGTDDAGRAGEVSGGDALALRSWSCGRDAARAMIALASRNARSRNASGS